MKKKEALKIFIFLLVINTFILLALVYPKFTGKVVFVEANVTRVIDGDTFESGDEKYRLLGINSPEKNMLYYEQAKNFLTKLEGKQVSLEITEKDKYGRNLAYVWDEVLINEEILKAGLAHLYYYEKDDNYRKMKKAEEQARNKELGIWGRSSNYGCIELVSLKYQENERCKNQEQLILNNGCAPFKAVLKDDATHIYKIEIEDVFVMNFSCVFNDDGDSVYIWDGEGLLLFYRY